MPLQLTLRPLPIPIPSDSRRPTEQSVLAVVHDRDDVDLTLPAAIARATGEDRQLYVAIIRPRPLWTMDAALLDRLAEESDRQITDLLQLVLARTATVGRKTTISVHLIRGLRGRRRWRVLDRIVRRLARHYDAQPLGTWKA